MFKQDIEGLNKHREQPVRDIKNLLQDNKRVACIRYTGYCKKINRSSNTIKNILRKHNLL